MLYRSQDEIDQSTIGNPPQLNEVKYTSYPQLIREHGWKGGPFIIYDGHGIIGALHWFFTCITIFSAESYAVLVLVFTIPSVLQYMPTKIDNSLPLSCLYILLVGIVVGVLFSPLLLGSLTAYPVGIIFYILTKLVWLRICYVNNYKILYYRREKDNLYGFRYESSWTICTLWHIINLVILSWLIIML